MDHNIHPMNYYRLRKRSLLSKLARSPGVWWGYYTLGVKLDQEYNPETAHTFRSVFSRALFSTRMVLNILKAK